MQSINSTVSITDYKMVTPTMAKVIIAFTGNPTKEQLTDMLAEKFDNLAAPVENSFQKIKANVAVGFLRANREVRVVDEKELRASYRVMGSNILMDNNDKSLWELKEGRAGTFLARQGQEDLSELVEASVYRRTDVPGLRHVQMAAASSGEFASFVSKTGDLDHGFVLQADSKKAQILSMTTRLTEVVANDRITRLDRAPVPTSFHKKMITSGISPKDKTQAKDYWDALFGYAPEYAQELKDQVDQTTFL